MKICFGPNLQPGLHKVPQFLSVYRNIVFGQPVAVQNRSAQRCLFVRIWKVLQCNEVYILICPFPLVLLNESAEGNVKQRIVFAACFDHTVRGKCVD